MYDDSTFRCLDALCIRYAFETFKWAKASDDCFGDCDLFNVQNIFIFFFILGYWEFVSAYIEISQIQNN